MDNYKRYNINLSSLYDKVATQGFIDTIKKVLDMIDTNDSQSMYRMNASNITFQEDILAHVIDKDINLRDYTGTSIQKNNIRFCYIDDKDFYYDKIIYPIHSNIDDTDNMMISFIIGSKAKRTDMYELLISIIYSKILVETQEYTNGCDIFDIVNDSIFRDAMSPKSNDRIQYMLNFVDLYSTLFRILDDVIDLKYEEFDDISNVLYKKIFEISTAVEYNNDIDKRVKLAYKIYFKRIYEYSVTRNSDEEDYKELIYKLIELTSSGVYLC